MKKNKSAIVVIVIIIAVVIGYFVGQSTTPGNDVIVYPVQCVNANASDFDSCISPVALWRSEYVVEKSSDTVLERQPDSTTPTFSTYNSADGCTIVDSNNWSCGGFPGGFGFSNGKPFNGDFNDLVIFVSQAQWDSINNGVASPLSAYPKGN